MGDKLSASDKAPVESAIAALKGAVESGDAAAMNTAMEALTQAQHKVAETLYKQTGSGAGAAPGAAPGPEPGPAATEGDVIDAEVVEDEKK